MFVYGTDRGSFLADSSQCQRRLQYTEVSDSGEFEFSDLPHTSVNNLTTQTTLTTDIGRLQYSSTIVECQKYQNFQLRFLKIQ